MIKCPVCRAKVDPVLMERGDIIRPYNRRVIGICVTLPSAIQKVCTSCGHVIDVLTKEYKHRTMEIDFPVEYKGEFKD